MNEKTKARLIQAVNKYKAVEKQVGTKFDKIPKWYFWIFGVVNATIFMMVYSVYNPSFILAYGTDWLFVFGFLGVVTAVLFTGFAIMIVGFLVLCIVLAPMIQNKIKDAKTIWIDYPKLLHEGIFNENTDEVVKNYLRLVFRGELEIIRKTLKAEIHEEIKNSTGLANSSFQEQQKQIEKQNDIIKSQQEQIGQQNKLIRKLQNDLQKAFAEILRLKDILKKLKGD